MARTAAKTATYSAMHMAVAIAVAWTISGDWRIALGIGLIEPLVQTIAYTIHERLWSRIGIGRRRASDDRPDADRGDDEGNVDGRGQSRRYGHAHRHGHGLALPGARTAP